MVTAGLSVIAALLGYVGLTYYLNERPEYAGAEPFDRVYYVRLPSAGRPTVRCLASRCISRL